MEVDVNTAIMMNYEGYFYIGVKSVSDGIPEVLTI